MENEKYLSEEKYQKNSQNLKKIGKILLIIGIIILVISFIMIILGFTGFGSTITNGIESNQTGDINGGQIAKNIFGSFGLFVIGGIVNTIGLFLTIAGAVIMVVAHRREIAAFTTQQVMPVAQEGIDKITPTVANAAGSVAKSISKGIADGKKESEENKEE